MLLKTEKPANNLFVSEDEDSSTKEFSCCFVLTNGRRVTRLRLFKGRARRKNSLTHR
jgi:hypothetical protein